MKVLPAKASTGRIHPRHHARVAAVQALFALDMADGEPDGAVTRIAHMTAVRPEAEDYVQELVAGVCAQQADIDARIERAAPMWPLPQIARVDKAIMRLAVYELLHVPDTPPKVVINEAVEIAKTYAADSSPRFINGVLGTIYEREVADVSEHARP